MSLQELASRYHELPRDREVVLYCSCPQDAASAQATLLLRKKGFERVWPLAGGIEAWRAGGPIVKSPGVTRRRR
jgi:rhodanese-related sulfurtransferase